MRAWGDDRLVPVLRDRKEYGRFFGPDSRYNPLPHYTVASGEVAVTGPISRPADDELCSILFTIRLVEQFVYENGHWPRSWAELENLPFSNVAPQPIRRDVPALARLRNLRSLHGFEWPSQAPFMRKHVAIDFDIVPKVIISQPPSQFAAIRPVVAVRDYRGYGFIESLQQTLRRAIHPHYPAILRWRTLAHRYHRLSTSWRAGCHRRSRLSRSWRLRNESRWRVSTTGTVESWQLPNHRRRTREFEAACSALLARSGMLPANNRRRNRKSQRADSTTIPVSLRPNHRWRAQAY